MAHALAIDIGGTKLSWSLIDRSYKIISHEQTKTPKKIDALIKELDKIIRAAVNSVDDLDGVGIGVAGLVDFNLGTVVAAPNLPLVGARLAPRITDRFDLKCSMDNDASLAILGELFCGAGRGLTNFFGLTVGTGIGGGIILNKKLYHGEQGGAAEFGHIVVDAGGFQCTCGHLGCLETRASGTAIDRAAKKMVEAKPTSALARRAQDAPKGITGPMVFEAAREGDQDALAILADIGQWLGIGIGSLINVLDPELVVIGGGAASAIELVHDVVREEMAKTVINPRSKQIPTAISTLANRAGLLGAAALVFEF